MSVNKFELILVDDDSTDGTHEILINLKKEIISLDILSEKKKKKRFITIMFSWF